ncbi:hypothetical protein Gdia_3035 [Gluconacetobacter diazotrophicus PA1 5]|nr:hypothetical protein Gdia_3035 [Gluconacetobacter diazotrophicus PA1 5]TWB06110.1 hypothetical protein FBZ86_11217 [Gluconacetobacter diazotrophicus]
MTTLSHLTNYSVVQVVDSLAEVKARHGAPTRNLTLRRA